MTSIWRINTGWSQCGLIFLKEIEAGKKRHNGVIFRGNCNMQILIKYFLND